MASDDVDVLALRIVDGVTAAGGGGNPAIALAVAVATLPRGVRIAGRGASCHGH